MKITRDDFVGVAGIVPTPATPDAGQWHATQTIAYDEAARMIDLVIGAGVDIVMTTGTFGECATLTWPELQGFVERVVQATARRAPVFAGVTTLNTRDTIERARVLLKLGADGVFVGRPMWLAMDDAGIVRYYRDLAQALPRVPLVIYDNHIAFKGKISTAVYRELARIPEIIATKHMGGPALEGDMLAVGNAMRVLPLAPEWGPVAERHPELARACWSGGVACAPTPIVAVARAIAARDWLRVREITERLKWAEAPMFPSGELGRFMDYSIQIAHIRFKAAGLIDPGPPRPPYLDLPAEYALGAEECGRRWAQLQREFAA
ncbi:MAG: dihydrodipicolinate synthase family protein [Burkholderiaceae bacterium]|nr:dihydrodipicolinate synthase family protein [Burkholderiaceae bacterium]MEB2350360.1 dihydrodipicolinate synthase family protein [Burkholderiaceae bacterium]